MRMTFKSEDGCTIDLGSSPAGVLIGASDGVDWGGGFVTPERARDIARALLMLADHTEKRGDA
jgi:hypothetical protein